MDTVIELVKMYAVELQINERLCARINELKRFIDEEERAHIEVMDRVTPAGIMISAGTVVNIEDVRKHLSISQSVENTELLAEISRRRQGEKRD